MPELSEYRQRFNAYQAELSEDEYLYLTGRKSGSDRDHIQAEYSDLFRLSAIKELGRAHEEVAAWRETERAAIRRLKAFAIEGFVAGQAAEVTSEIDRYKGRQQAASRANPISVSTDLFAERIEIFQRSIVSTGYESFSDSRRDLKACDPAALATSAEKLLSLTENRYVSGISEFLPAAAGVTIDEAIDADLDHLDYYTSFDAWFTSEKMKPLYRELFDGLGFNAERQTNLSLTSIDETARIKDSLCFPVRVPDDIRLVAVVAEGQRAYRRFFRAAGRAQNYAWTSKDLHPEFRFVTEWGDSALLDCWAGLLAGLVTEDRWLQGSLGLIESTVFRDALRLIRLVEIRRHAALHLYELEMLESDLSKKSSSIYVDRMQDALKVRYNSSGHLAEISPAFSHGNHLRGVALEYHLREFLRTRFGSRWWTSRKAGEMIIDLWNTGQRYSVEEMAAMIGLGELDYEWLANQIV